MIVFLFTAFAALLGLAFGSFLNVCLTRWPEGESIVEPRSHCRHCTHTLAWWENIPLFSWLCLRGRCRGCRAWIGWRYPLVELAVAVLWIAPVCQLLRGLPSIYNENVLWGSSATQLLLCEGVLYGFAQMFFYWLLVALAVLDAENLWLPDKLTLPGIGIGLAFTVAKEAFGIPQDTPRPIPVLIHGILGVLAAAALILLIRWLYRLFRHREGMGLGDAKLMALLAAWLGLPLALVAFALGIVTGAVIALLMQAIPATHRAPERWAACKLPLGAFLCIGGIVSSLWGEAILNAYLRWAGF